MKRSLLAAAAVLAVGAAQAQISVGTTSFSYSQSFDTLASAGTNVAWAGNSTLLGWFLAISNGAQPATYNADTGGSNTGSFVSYGSSGSSDRALGSLASGGAYFGSPASGAAAGYVVATFSNDTGVPLAGFTMRYDGEQWRNGGNTTAQSLTVQYGFGASFATVSWQSPGAGFDFVSPVATATAAAVDGNAAGRVAGLGGSVSAAWAPGTLLWVRWTDLNDTGNDHGLAIDNVSFSVTPVPEPGTTALLLAGLAAVGFLARRRR